MKRERTAVAKVTFEQLLFASALSGALAQVGAEPEDAVEMAMEAFLLARAALKGLDGSGPAKPKAGGAK